MQASRFLAFGCHNLTGGSSTRKSIRLVHCALDHGISRFDVAPSYGLGTAESVLGAAIRKGARQIEITTKFGIEPPRFSSVLAWGHAPFRRFRMILGKGPFQLLAGPENRELPRIRLLKSLERSLKVLGIERLHMFVSHERIDGTLLAEHLSDLAIARKRGLIDLFGCSGQRDAVEQTLSMFSGLAQVVQVPVCDGDAFSGFPVLRLFGAVRALAPQIARHADFDEHYRDRLRSVLTGVNTLQECSALGAIAAARILFPQSVLLVNSSDERHIGNIVRFSADQSLLDWCAAYRAIHKQMLAHGA